MTLLFGHIVTVNCHLTRAFWHCVKDPALIAAQPPTEEEGLSSDWTLRGKGGTIKYFDDGWPALLLLKCYETISWCLSKGAGLIFPLASDFHFKIAGLVIQTQCLIQTAARHYQQSGNQAPVANAPSQLLSPLFKSAFHRRDRLEETKVEPRFWCEHTKQLC